MRGYIGSWVRNQVQTAQSFYNNNLPWAVAGTLNSAISIVGVVGQIPQAMGNVGTGIGTFSANPTLANSAGMFQDVSVVASTLIPVAGIVDNSLATVADGTSAATPIGRSGDPITVPAGNNAPATINGVNYSAHALDQMQSDGIMPSAVQNTIQQGQATLGKVPGTTAYYEPVNNVTVVTDASSGRIVTVSYCRIRQ